MAKELETLCLLPGPPFLTSAEAIQWGEKLSSGDTFQVSDLPHLVLIDEHKYPRDTVPVEVEVSFNYGVKLLIEYKERWYAIVAVDALFPA